LLAGDPCTTFGGVSPIPMKLGDTTYHPCTLTEPCHKGKFLTIEVAMRNG